MSDMKISSVQTTSLGIASILASLSAIIKTIATNGWAVGMSMVDWQMHLPVLINSIGLIRARDHKTSDEQAGAGVKPVVEAKPSDTKPTLT